MLSQWDDCKGQKLYIEGTKHRVTYFCLFNCSYYLLKLVWVFMHKSQVQEKSHLFISLIYISFSDLPHSPRREFNISCILEASNPPPKGVKNLLRSAFFYIWERLFVPQSTGPTYQAFLLLNLGFESQESVSYFQVQKNALIFSFISCIVVLYLNVSPIANFFWCIE